jgi:hypothetical protein
VVFAVETMVVVRNIVAGVINPVEYLNNDEKSEVNALKLPESEPELRSNMKRFLQRLARLPEHVLSYFEHPCISYVLEPV